MHDVAVIVFMSLVLFKVVDLVEDYIPAFTKLHGLMTMLLAAVGTYWMDYSMFDGLGIDLRESWMGPVFTGLMVGATTSAWRAVFHYLGSSEGEAPEVRHPHVVRAA